MRAENSVLSGRCLAGKDSSGQNDDGGFELHRNGYKLVYTRNVRWVNKSGAKSRSESGS